MRHSESRRTFIKNTAAAVAFSAITPLGYGSNSLQEPLKVGLIGSGWYGKSDLFRLIQVAPVEVLGICDVDQRMLKEAGELVSQRQQSGRIPKLYSDYRQMLEKHDFDIVLVGSPDHWHALHAIEAIKSGAHVYVQKPISVDVVEGEAMLKAARKYNRVVQVGTQRRSTPHLMEAKEKIVDAGLLGDIGHVEICCYTGKSRQGQPEVVPVPDFFDYDFWTGPAPMLPFTGLPHRRWRAHMEYGNGMIGDMGIHMLDAARWMLGVGWPRKITSVGGTYVNEKAVGNRPDTQHAIFEFDEMNFVWQHRMWGQPDDPDYWWSFKIYGDKGTLKASVRKAEFIPVDGDPVRFDVLYEKEEYPEDLTEDGMELFAAPATRRHMQNFLQSIENNTKPVADIEQGHISSACCILANISADLEGRPLSYDPEKKIITGDPEATNLLAREYREPWVHPTIDNI